MARTAFDPYDWCAHYHGGISREEAEEILGPSDVALGTFLIRNSSSKAGDYVLCVKESQSADGRGGIRNYLIKVETRDDDSNVYVLADDQSFPDVASLLNYYKMHYLSTTPLTAPAPRLLVDKAQAKFDFVAQQEHDLSFKKGELLAVVGRETAENGGWWTARNELGRTGHVPATYLQVCPDAMADEEVSGRFCGVLVPSLRDASIRAAGSSASEAGSSSRNSDQSTGGLSSESSAAPADNSSSTTTTTATCTTNSKGRASEEPRKSLGLKLPAKARVTQDRTPSAYDKQALKLRTGDLLTILAVSDDGMWTGELRGKTGKFPFTYVELVADQRQSR